MKRIAAVAALIVAMLALPAAAAMASTSTSGSGSGHVGQSLYCQPNPFQHRHHNRHHNRHHGRHHGHHGHHQFNNCNSPYPLPPSGFCNGASFTFSWGTGFNNLYELSGPALSSGEQFSFDGSLYTIVNANPTASSYELNTINFGPTVFVGTGYLC